jgi:hypothetical protein
LRKAKHEEAVEDDEEPNEYDEDRLDSCEMGDHPTRAGLCSGGVTLFSSA